MARVPKTTRKEHETSNRVRFRFLIEQGETQAEAARILKLPRGTAKLWLKKRDSNRRTRSNGARLGRRPIISDEKVQEMIDWTTGYFNRRVLPL
jgi:transposase